MAKPIYVSVSSAGTYGPYNLDYLRTPMNATVGVAFTSSSMTGTYGVQYTLDDITQTSASNLRWFADANLPPGTSSGAVSNYTFPVCAVRLVVTAISSGNMELKILQGIGG